MITARPPQEGTPHEMSGKGDMRGPFGGTLAASVRSVVVALVLLGVGNGRDRVWDVPRISMAQ